MKLVIDERQSRFDILKTWFVRVAVALLFVFVGSTKFRAQSPFIHIFDQIGLGQWFRYCTGILQIAGGLLVLIPRASVFGILILACTMAGAAASWIFLLGAPMNAFIPGALLGGLLFVGGEELMELFSSRQKRL